jgi:hypothetical protein
MSTISLRLPESLHARVREVAQREGISINQVISTALAEKLSALLTEDYLADRAARGNPTKYERALKKARGREPEPGDEV